MAELAPIASTLPEAEIRKRLANRVADLSAPQWREDVRGRKTTIALGEADFRGRHYKLADWGLGEFRAA